MNEFFSLKAVEERKNALSLLNRILSLFEMRVGDQMCTVLGCLFMIFLKIHIHGFLYFNSYLTQQWYGRLGDLSCIVFAKNSVLKVIMIMDDTF